MINNIILKKLEWKKLGNFLRVKGGFAFKSKDFVNEGVPIVRISNFNNSNVDLDECVFYPQEKLEEFENFLLEEKDILIAMSGATTGKIGRVSGIEGRLLLNQRVGKFEIFNDQLDKEYLYFFVKSDYFQNKVWKFASGCAQPNVSSKQLESIEIPVPPLPIQHKIVSILERSEKLKNLRQEANDETNSIIQALFSDMFGDPVKNEKNYTVKPLVEICHRITDGTHITPKYTNTGVPFLRVTDVTNSNESKKFISEEEHKELIKRCKPEKGDVLYTKNGTIGIAKLIDWDYEFSIFVSLCLIKPKKEIILPKYLEIFLNTPFALRQALLHSKKGTITNLHLIEIKKILVPVPTLKEQEAFLKRVEQINNIQNNQTESTEEINTLFDALMQKAFNGELTS